MSRDLCLKEHGFVGSFSKKRSLDPIMCRTWAWTSIRATKANVVQLLPAWVGLSTVEQHWLPWPKCSSMDLSSWIWAVTNFSRLGGATNENRTNKHAIQADSIVYMYDFLRKCISHSRNCKNLQFLKLRNSSLIIWFARSEVAVMDNLECRRFQCAQNQSEDVLPCGCHCRDGKISFCIKAKYHIMTQSIKYTWTSTWEVSIRHCRQIRTENTCFIIVIGSSLSFTQFRVAPYARIPVPYDYIANWGGD